MSFESYYDQAARIMELTDRIAQLEAALRSVRAIIASDSVEYDDVSNALMQIDAALAWKEPT